MTLYTYTQSNLQHASHHTIHIHIVHRSMYGDTYNYFHIATRYGTSNSYLLLLFTRYKQEGNSNVTPDKSIIITVLITLFLLLLPPTSPNYVTIVS